MYLIGYPKERSMTPVTFTDYRKNLAHYMDKAYDDCDAIVVTRQNKRAVVMLSLDDYNGLLETAHLLRSPANAKSLLEGIAQAERGEGVIRELVR